MSGRVRVVTVVTRFEAGAGVVALRGAMELDRDRFDVRFVAGSGGRLLEEAAAAGFDVRLEPGLRPDIAPVDDLRAVRRLTEVLERERPDVVHTHSAKAGAIGRVAAHRAGVGRVVHTYHGFPFHDFQSPARRAAYVAIERRLGRITDVGLCVGTAVAVEAVRRRLVPPEKVRTITVDVDRTSGRGTHDERRAEARSRLGLPEDALVVGAVGRLCYQKAPEDFVAALSLLHRPGVVGVWIGDGERAARMRRAVETARPWAPVLLAGERSDVVELLPALDVFALPSRYEGVPVAIAEAVMSGVPVVATAVNAVSDVVIPGVTGLLVPPERPELMATAIGHVLDHPAEASAMAAAAWLRLAGGYGLPSLGHVLADVYLPPTCPPTRSPLLARDEGASRAR